jgi:hypothetical protein
MTNPDVRWTLKAPALIAGLIALVGGLVATKRGRVGAGIVLVALGIAFVAYSLTIKEWCALHQHGWGGGAWNQTGFGGDLGECLKQKGWFSF